MTAAGAASPIPGGAPLSDGAKAILNEYKNYASGLTGNQPMQEFGAWVVANKDRLTAATPGGRDAVNQVRSIYNGYVGDTTPTPPPPMTALRQEAQKTFGNNKSLPLDSPGYVPPAVTTTELPGGEQPSEGGGIMGFLGKNKGGIIGAVIGFIINMVTGGGGGIMGMLLPLLLGAGGSLLVDGGKGMLGGLLGMGNNQTPPAQGAAQAQGQGVNAPAVAMSQSVSGVDQPVTMLPNAQVKVRNGTQVIDGNNSFSAATGTPPHGNEITLIERGNNGAPGYQYTGRVEGNSFLITSVAASVPGTNPPQMAAPVRPNPPLSLPITPDGNVSFNQPSSPLSVARTQAMDKVARFNAPKDLPLTEIPTPPGQTPQVSARLDPVVRDGVTYNVTLQGTRNSSGLVTFDRATMTQTSGTPPTTTPVNNPNNGAPSFEVRNLPPMQQSNTNPKKVSIAEGLASSMGEDLVNFSRSGQRARDQRKNITVSAINSSPDASQALNNLESTLSTQLTQSGMNPLDANLAATTVSNFYAKPENRGPNFNADALKEQLKSTMRPAIPGNAPQRALTDRQVDAIVAEVGSQNSAINTAVNAKPMAPSPTTSVSSMTAAATIPRIARPAAAPTVGVAVAPMAIPGLNTGTSAGIGG
jgi:hypothetical protein